MRYGWICLLLSAFVSTAVIVGSIQGKKWLAAVCLGVIVVVLCLILQKFLRPLFLAGAVFLIPVRIDFYLIYKPTAFIPTAASPGFPVTLFDIVLLILVGYWLFQVLKGEQKIKFFPSISIPFLAFIVFTGISACWSAEFVHSFSLWFVVIKSYVAFLFFANHIKSGNDIKIVMCGLCAGVLLQSAIALLQYTGIASFGGLFGGPDVGLTYKVQGGYILSRVTGTFGTANSLAKYLGFCIPAIFVFAYYNFHSLSGKLALLSAAAGGFTLLLTMTRGSWIGVGFAMTFVFFELLKRHFNSRLKSMILVILLVSGTFIGTVGVFEDVRIRLFESDYRSAQSRIPMAKVALNIITSNPIRGVGLSNYTRVMQQYDRTRNWQTYKFPWPVHNSYLLIAAESGIPTLLVFLWIIVAVVYLGWPAFGFSGSFSSLLQVGWLASLSTSLIAGMFDLNYPGANTMLWFIIAMIAATSRLSSADQARSAPPVGRLNRAPVRSGGGK